MESEPAGNVKLLCLDVDGVLTDGSITIDDHGIEAKRFYVRDGTAMKAWMRLGNELAIITGRQSMAVTHRMAELGVRYVFQGVGDKAAVVGGLCNSLKIPASHAAMVGDDLPDLRALQAVGYPIAVADGVPEVRRVAAYVTVSSGGRGVVREVIEHLLKARGRWEEVVNMFRR